VARTLSDEAWVAICAAAKPHTPDADARPALSKVLFEDYPGFAYDRERTIAAIERAERMLEHLDAFTADHNAQFPQADYIKTERDRFYIQRLQQRAEAVWIANRTLQDANAGRRNVQRAMLYHWLCGVWLDHFHATKLTYSRQAGEPSGPLVDFILAAMLQIMPEDALPSREAVRENIDRDRRERGNAEQLARQLRKRSQTSMGD
jgi:hypothetical protein